jgi:hypothetical protein
MTWLDSNGSKLSSGLSKPLRENGCVTSGKVLEQVSMPGQNSGRGLDPRLRPASSMPPDNLLSGSNEVTKKAKPGNKKKRKKKARTSSLSMRARPSGVGHFSGRGSDNTGELAYKTCPRPAPRSLDEL